MQGKIEDLKFQIESLKKELLALPNVEDKNEIEDLQAYIRLSTELLKAVAAFQVLKNVQEEQVSKPEEQVAKSEQFDAEEKIEIGTLESVIAKEDIQEKPAEQVATSQKQHAAGIEVAEMIANNAINDLRTAFGLNERFYYTNELFRGDGQEFVRAINEFNHLSSFDDAKKLIEAKYIPQFGWSAENEVAEEFLTIIKRRYS